MPFVVTFLFYSRICDPDWAGITAQLPFHKTSLVKQVKIALQLSGKIDKFLPPGICHQGTIASLIKIF